MKRHTSVSLPLQMRTKCCPTRRTDRSTTVTAMKGCFSIGKVGASVTTTRSTSSLSSSAAEATSEGAASVEDRIWNYESTSL